MGRFRIKKILKRDLRSILSMKFDEPAVRGLKFSTSQKKLQKVPVAGQKINPWTDDFSNFVSDKNLKSPNWQIPQVALPSTGPRPQKILN